MTLKNKDNRNCLRLERIITTPIHVLSCLLIIHSVKINKLKWFWYAFAYKVIIDIIAGFIYISYGIENLTTSIIWITEVILLPFGIIDVIGLLKIKKLWSGAK